MHAIVKLSVVLSLVAIGSACSSLPPEECDPNEYTGMVHAYRCKDASKTREARLQAEIRSMVIQKQLTEAETTRLQAQADRLAADRDAWQSELSRLQIQNKRLQSKLAFQRADNSKQKRRLQELKKELAQGQKELEEAQKNQNATKAEIQALLEENAKRRKVIEEVTGLVLDE